MSGYRENVNTRPPIVAVNAFTIIPNDNQPLPVGLQVVKTLYVGTGGDVKVRAAGGGEVTFKNMPDGGSINLRIDKVYSTGTTASDLVGLV